MRDDRSWGCRVKSQMRMTIAKKLIGVLFVIILSLSALIPIVVATAFRGFYKENISREALNISQALAAAIEFTYPEDFFYRSMDDETQNLNGLLQQTVDNSDLNHLYILRAEEGPAFTYVADAAGIRGHAGPLNLRGALKPKTDCRPAMLTVFESGQSACDEDIVYSDTLGDSICGYAPIRYNDKTVAVIAVDVYAKDLNALIARYTGLTVLVVLAANGIAGAIYVTLVRRQVVEPLDKILDASVKIASHDLDFTVDITSNDEMGDIAVVINTAVVPALAELRDKNIRIEESMSYAGRIQHNILPDDAEMAKVFRDFYVWWQPKEAVGGDIYWLERFKEGTVLVLGDCTGHAVPGAMMTMMVNAVLSQIVTAENCSRPEEIISQLDKKMAASLGNNSLEANAIKDGLDAMVLFVAPDKTITLAATNISIFITSGSSTQTIKGQRSAIGEGNISSPELIKVHTIPYDPHNMYFLATDGVIDQIGEKTGLPFGNARLKRILSAEGNVAAQQTIAQLTSKFNEHMGNSPQRDDVTVIGFGL